jgi:hypothetical protein
MNENPVELIRTIKGWRVTLEAAQEHATHAWGDLNRDGLLPTGTSTDRWPPTVPASSPDGGMANVGHTPYHLAAMIMYVQRVYEAMVQTVGDDDDDGSFADVTNR